ncbi:MAG: serine hydrolase domain-containing protein [Bacteroidota bacterium]
MKNIFTLLWIIFVCMSCSNQKANSQTNTLLETKIDSLFTEFNRLDTPGYAIGVSKNGKTLYAKGFGAANLDYNLPITSKSAFSIASVSKQFTAACVALLILDGKLSLETPAVQFIPELKKYKDTIRIKHLIYNTSGITDYPRLERKSGKSWITFNYFDIDECIATSLAEDELQFTPGDRWDYCNVNFMLLTKIVEKVSGMSFSQFAKERLFAPLQMNHTLINDDITEIIPNRVTPYNFRTKESIAGYGEYDVKLKNESDFIQHPRNSPHYGGSGVVTTIEDLLKWSENMVSKTFGGQAFYDLMHKTIKFNHDRDNQAFGLYIGDYNGRKIVAWDGGDWGISSQLLRFPDEGVAITVLSNIGTGEAYRKVNAIAQILIDEGFIK